MNEELVWYFTFGSGHQYPNGYIKLNGTFGDARKRMFELFEDKWAMQYSEKDFGDQAERFGLV